MKNIWPILLLLLSAFPGFGQKVNGIWKGSLTVTSGCFPVNNIEIQISLDGNTVSGDSYHYLDIHNYVKKRVTGTYLPDQKKVIVQEREVTTFKIPPHCQPCIRRLELTYSAEGNIETLSGRWTGTIMNTTEECQPGTITLSRTRESAFKEIPEINVDTGQIRLDFYDNGEVDGDSITVLVNKNVILSHQKLTGKPVTAFINITEDQTFQEIEMLGENQGTIPPNTALLIITAGKKRYQLFLTSSETKRAVVRFIYDKENGATRL